jgi:Uma2 family endonuclease
MKSNDREIPLMATSSRPAAGREIEYPTSDGKPMAETDLHRDLMLELIETLKDYFAAHPTVYVSGNMLLFYERGNKRKHVAPDVFVVRGVEKRRRDNYLVWQEGKGPDLIIELTSKTTRREDQQKKLALYRDVLKVPEYFLFDPYEDYLKPPFQGYRLVEGQYVPIEPVAGRLPGAVLGLHLERSGTALRLHDPVTGRWLPTPRERAEKAEAQRDEAIAELERLRRELDELQRRSP